MLRQAKRVEVGCFGQCGTDLVCRCKKANRLCMVHGKYGSLCMGCLSHLVASTILHG